MKKLIAFLLAAMMLLSLCACSKDDTTASTTGSTEAQSTEADSSEKESTEAEQTEAPETKLNLGDAITTDSLEYTVNSFVLSKVLKNIMDEEAYMPVDDSADDFWLYDVDNNPYKADDDHVMLMVELTQKNIGKAAIGFVDEYATKIVYGDGYEFAAHAGSCQDSDGDFGGFSFKEMEPLSDAVVCRIVFDLPAEAAEDETIPMSFFVTIDGTDYEYVLR